MGLIMASYLGLYEIPSGLTKSTDHPSNLNQRETKGGNSIQGLVGEPMTERQQLVEASYRTGPQVLGIGSGYIWATVSIFGGHHEIMHVFPPRKHNCTHKTLVNSLAQVIL